MMMMILYKWSQAQVQYFFEMHIKQVVFMNRTFKILIFDFSDAKIQPAFTCWEGNRFWLFSQ